MKNKKIIIIVLLSMAAILLVTIFKSKFISTEINYSIKGSFDFSKIISINAKNLNRNFIKNINNFYIKKKINTDKNISCSIDNNKLKLLIEHGKPRDVKIVYLELLNKSNDVNIISNNIYKNKNIIKSFIENGYEYSNYNKINLENVEIIYDNNTICILYEQSEYPKNSSNMVGELENINFKTYETRLVIIKDNIVIKVYCHWNSKDLSIFKQDLNELYEVISKNIN
ncbi:hypothetical protein [Anaerofustis stercorihominis]|uniref:Uncharacterized protein n=1 Tax=Anaerofustis stercorihominis TaxID=214853 RepID=A0A3E3E0E5_9FIRM|nr:hypothetical protein [Anaerofustis stercorihominis]RGD75022.1 hypothetical protein DW687_01485 [Anaerofustis stercorihominis]